MSLLSWLSCFRKERLPHVRYLPLAALLSLAAFTPPHLLPLSVGLSWFLVASYRLRDDLADRELDATVHPERVLCRVKDPARLRELYGAAWAGMALGAFALGCMGASVARAVGGLVLLGVVELGYRHASHERRGWVLLKYPVFVLLQQSAFSVEGAVAALLVYVGIGLFEMGDDARVEGKSKTALTGLFGFGLATVLIGGWIALLGLSAAATGALVMAWAASAGLVHRLTGGRPLRSAAFVVLTMTALLSVLQRVVGGGQSRFWVSTLGGSG
jgi:hypothetical protein